MEKAASSEAAPLRSAGSSRKPKARKATPTTATEKPTGVKSNMWNGSPRRSWRICETMMLGEVPTSVMVPPRSEPKAIGMSR